MSPEQIKLLTSPAALDFYSRYEKTPASALALRFSGKRDLPYKELITQLGSRQKAASKFPRFHSIPGFIFPVPVSIEQASSQFTAEWKAGLIPQGSIVTDLTGGMGADSYFFSLRAAKVVMVEPDEELCILARHNFRILGTDNIEVVCSSAADFLPEMDPASFVFLDPSRRKEGRRSLGISEYSPDPAEVVSFLNENGNEWMVKVSPMEDIDRLNLAFGGCSDVFVLSHRKEVRELLFKGPGKVTDTLIHASGPEGEQVFSFTRAEERDCPPLTGFPEAGGFLYDPWPALLKAGPFKLLAKRTGTVKPELSTHLYFSGEQCPFPGRAFRILEQFSPDEAMLRKIFKGKKLVVAVKNFPGKPEAIAARLGILPGENLYIWFYTAAGNRRWAAYCEKISL